MSWQPIETAPKDRRIIVWTGLNQYVAQWGENQEIGGIAWIITNLDHGDRLIVEATLWHEAPDNPKE